MVWLGLVLLGGGGWSNSARVKVFFLDRNAEKRNYLLPRIPSKCFLHSLALSPLLVPGLEQERQRMRVRVRVRVGVALRGFLTKARVPLTPVRQRDENSASQPHIIRLSGTAAYFLSLLFPFFFVFVSQQLVLLSSDAF